MSQYQVTYIDGGGRDVSIIVQAKSEMHAEIKFRNQYGGYYIVKVVKLSK